ncbi:uncharacterized protein LOC116195085 [Punica granatum]|uniref:Uncharacterized protein n=2 Tax=Punica granatum TaxID=22663 RepID=A0A218XSN4_PUNGR|nr:uncharacterized protein LOC116195085 [Punica granatum]OWM87944.1 hypothetical protein CDL15_Pgr000361 [Punica granatum]PKH47780.1 hypothetical protein CRG98_050443 [Punica granatum]
MKALRATAVPISLSSFSSHPPPLSHFHFHRLLPGPRRFSSITCSFARRRPRRSRRLGRNSSSPGTSTFEARPSKTEPSSDVESLKLTIDLNHWTHRVKPKLDQFVCSGREAYGDLRTLITLDENRRVLISCRRSTVEFVGGLVVVSFVMVSVFRVLVKLCVGLGSRLRFNNGKTEVVVRRDRSLGGREVVVGTRQELEKFRALDSPLAPGRGNLDRVSQGRKQNFGVRFQNELPEWWPSSLPGPDPEVDREEYQRDANRLIRAIVDNRLHGKDIAETDIIQLRRICRTSGIHVSFGTTNTRDYFYRTSVDFVLNVCSRPSGQSMPVQIDGEDVRVFVAGLAGNIGLENIRAARIVSAAVAARTRSTFLQAWALEMQGEHAGSLEELSKIWFIHRIFPPKENSPEMEMVALGLRKQLRQEHREFLMNMLVGVCCEESPRSLAEALGLALPPQAVAADHEGSLT